MPSTVMPGEGSQGGSGPAVAAAHRDHRPPDPAQPGCEQDAYMPRCPGGGCSWTRGGGAGALICPSCGAGTDRIPGPATGIEPVPAHVPGALPSRLVHVADWHEPADPEAARSGGWLNVNAPRWLPGEKTWTGDCRAGVFYARARCALAPFQAWRELDASLIVFIDQDQVEAAAAAHARRFGYDGPEAVAAAGFTLADFADALNLPWRPR